MPMLSQTSTNFMLSFKIVLISTIFLSAGIMLKFSAPAITDFAVYEVPSIYNGVVSWLRPPYLYLLINCIIISIVASSKLQSKKDEDDEPLLTPPQPLDDRVVQSQPQAPVAGLDVEDIVQEDEYKYNDVVLSNSSSYDVKVDEGVGGFGTYEDVGASVPLIVDDDASDGGIVFEDDATSNKENEYVIEKSTVDAPHRKDTTGGNVKSPVSSRFGHRRNLKAGSEGGKAVLGVSKPKKQDTLENTWKTITEGRAMPLTRHLRKNETWEKTNPPKVIFDKTETFDDRTADARSPLLTPSPGSGKLRKEPSLSQDELNRRVEAFIKKFNEEMRLQRQESLNQYVQMVNHGSR